MRKFYYKFNKILFAFFTILMLSGCDANFFPQLMKNTELSAKQLFYDIKEFNFSDFWYKIKTSYNTAKQSRYIETQKIKIETSRNTQISAYQSILNECTTYNCSIKAQDVNKNLIFPENITAIIDIEIPTINAESFLTAIKKYGNIVENNYSKDENIEKDLTYFYTELAILQDSLTKTNAQLNKDGVYNLKKLKEIQEYSSDLNRKISLLESDIKHLNSCKDKRFIQIKIERGYNSALNYVKSRIQNGIIFILDYIHIILFIICLFLIKQLYKASLFAITSLKVYIKTKKEQHKLNKETNNKEIDFKIPPKF